MFIKTLPGPAGGTTVTADYDCVYAVYYNNDGSNAIIAGGHVCFDSAATVAQNLGRAVKQPATAVLGLYAGCAPYGIATNSWGIVVTYGVIEEGGVSGGATSVAVGNYLQVANASQYAQSPTAASQGTGWIHAMEASTTSSETRRMLIRAM